MRNGFGLLLSVAAVGAAVGSGSASAQSLEFLHEHRQEGARICMKDHFHYGNSSGHATRQAAEKAAIANWSGFTAWEYGDRWGSWRLAGSRKVTCSGEPGSIGCQIEGRPCRPMTGGGQRPKRPAASAQ
jgi:hypothetical protein